MSKRDLLMGFLALAIVRHSPCSAQILSVDNGALTVTFAGPGALTDPDSALPFYYSRFLGDVGFGQDWVWRYATRLGYDADRHQSYAMPIGYEYGGMDTTIFQFGSPDFSEVDIAADQLARSARNRGLVPVEATARYRERLLEDLVYLQAEWRLALFTTDANVPALQFFGSSPGDHVLDVETNLIRMIDERIEVFDSAGRLQQVRWPTGEVEEVGYDSSGRVVTGGRPGRRFRTILDSTNHIVMIEGSPAARFRYQGTEFTARLVEMIVGPDMAPLLFDYDERGNLHSIRRQGGGTIEILYYPREALRDDVRSIRRSDGTRCIYRYFANPEGGLRTVMEACRDRQGRKQSSTQRHYEDE